MAPPSCVRSLRPCSARLTLPCVLGRAFFLGVLATTADAAPDGVVGSSRTLTPAIWALAACAAARSFSRFRFSSCGHQQPSSHGSHARHDPVACGPPSARASTRRTSSALLESSSSLAPGAPVAPTTSRATDSSWSLMWS